MPAEPPKQRKPRQAALAANKQILEQSIELLRPERRASDECAPCKPVSTKHFDQDKPCYLKPDHPTALSSHLAELLLLHHCDEIHILAIRACSTDLRTLVNRSRSLNQKIYNARHPTFEYVIVDSLPETSRATLVERATELGACEWNPVRSKPSTTRPARIVFGPEQSVVRQCPPLDLLEHTLQISEFSRPFRFNGDNKYYYSSNHSNIMSYEASLEWMARCWENDAGLVKFDRFTLKFQESKPLHKIEHQGTSFSPFPISASWLGVPRFAWLCRGSCASGPARKFMPLLRQQAQFPAAVASTERNLRTWMTDMILIDGGGKPVGPTPKKFLVNLVGKFDRPEFLSKLPFVIFREWTEHELRSQFELNWWKNPEIVETVGKPPHCEAGHLCTMSDRHQCNCRRCEVVSYAAHWSCRTCDEKYCFGCVPQTVSHHTLLRGLPELDAGCSYFRQWQQPSQAIWFPGSTVVFDNFRLMNATEKEEAKELGTGYGDSYMEQTLKRKRPLESLVLLQTPSTGTTWTPSNHGHQTKLVGISAGKVTSGVTGNALAVELEVGDQKCVGLSASTCAASPHSEFSFNDVPEMLVAKYGNPVSEVRIMFASKVPSFQNTSAEMSASISTFVRGHCILCVMPKQVMLHRFTTRSLLDDSDDDDEDNTSDKYTSKPYTVFKGKASAALILPTSVGNGVIYIVTAKGVLLTGTLKSKHCDGVSPSEKELGCMMKVLGRLTTDECPIDELHPVDIGHPIRDVSIGHNYVLAVSDNGDLWAWGDPASCKLGQYFEHDVPLPHKTLSGRNLVRCYASESHAAVLTSRGNLLSVGKNTDHSLGIQLKNGKYAIQPGFKEMDFKGYVTVLDRGLVPTDVACSSKGIVVAFGAPGAQDAAPMRKQKKTACKSQIQASLDSMQALMMQPTDNKDALLAMLSQIRAQVDSQEMEMPTATKSKSSKRKRNSEDAPTAKRIK